MFWQTTKNTMKSIVLETLVVVVMTLHLVACPYSKVEESFNIQAIHDILHHGFNISQYDHLEFPGVVPRSFLGPIAVAVTSFPLVYICQLLQLSKLCEQYIVRFVLGLFVSAGFYSFTQAVERRLGPDVKTWLILTTVTQFHFMFYMSRTLPNVFALVLVLGALGAWLQQQHRRFLWLSGAAILIFRSELVLFLGLILVADIASHRLNIKAAIESAIPAGIVLLGLTVLVDSYFWQRWLWPEGEVLWFNTVLNKSSLWGTTPFLWYFYSAMPRALSVTALLLPVGVWLNKPVRLLLWPALGFMLLYSLLPHKELRFIIYTFPVLNTVIAAAITTLQQTQTKSVVRSLLAVSAAGLLAGNLLSTAGFLYISQQNYPGGQAMHQLHQLETDEDVHVHIDVYTAQTGVTRFTQINPKWRYNKTEGLLPGGPEMMSYTHLMIEILSENQSEIIPYQTSHTVLTKITTLEHFKLNPRRFPYFEIKTQQKLWILKNIQQPAKGVMS